MDELTKNQRDYARRKRNPESLARLRASSKNWDLLNPEAVRLRGQRADKKRRPERLVYMSQYAKDTREDRRELKTANGLFYNYRTKAAALFFYSNGTGVCARCPEGDADVLTLDHIANDGAKQRRSGPSNKGVGLYGKLRRLGYPPGFQVLCMNCNLKKHLEFCREERGNLPCLTQ